MKRQTAQLGRLDAQILERLCLGINHLVEKLLLHLVRRHGRPPEEPVQRASNGLEDAFGEVDVAAAFVDFAVDELGDFGHGVIFGAVEFKGLRGGGVVLKHTFKGVADVNGLREWWLGKGMVRVMDLGGRGRKHT